MSDHSSTLLLGKLGFSRLKYLVQKHKSRKWWKQEAGSLTPKPVQLEQSCLRPSKGGRRRGAHGRAGFPHREAAKSELLLPVKLETTPLTFTWLARFQKKWGCWFSDASNAPLRHGVQPERKRDNTANYTSIVWNAHMATKKNDEESRVCEMMLTVYRWKSQVTDYR